MTMIESRNKDGKPSQTRFFLSLVAIVAGFATVGFLLFGPSGMSPKHVTDEDQAAFERPPPEEGSQWHVRHEKLLALTADYVDETTDVAPEIADGKRLAPKDYLNEKLSEEGLKWRVREVIGMDAKTFDVF